MHYMNKKCIVIIKLNELYVTTLYFKDFYDLYGRQSKRTS